MVKDGRPDVVEVAHQVEQATLLLVVPHLQGGRTGFPENGKWEVNSDKWEETSENCVPNFMIWLAIFWEIGWKLQEKGDKF